MKKKSLIALFGLGAILAPIATVFAQITISGNQTINCTGNDLGAIICRVGEVLNKVIPVLIVLGVVFFVWGVIMYVISSDEEAKKKGRNRMIWGIVGLVVIIGMWGLVAVVANTFGLKNQGDISLPTLPTEL